jgi:hypothetical protein
MMILSLAYLITQLQFNLNDSLNSTLKFLNDQSGILSLSSIVAAIAVFFYQQHTERKKFDERLRRSCKTLLIDINQIDQGFFGEKFTKTKIGDDIEYTNTSVGAEFYQSVVNQGDCYQSQRV